MKYKRQVLRAMADTIQAYEQSILDLETGQATWQEVRARWRGYGGCTACRLCKVSRTSYGSMDCGLCILNNQNVCDGFAFETVGCSKDSERTPTMRKTFHDLIDQMSYPPESEAEALKRLLRARLRALLSRCDENGYIFVEVKR